MDGSSILSFKSPHVYFHSVLLYSVIIQYVFPQRTSLCLGATKRTPAPAVHRPEPSSQHETFPFHLDADIMFSAVPVQYDITESDRKSKIQQFTYHFSAIHPGLSVQETQKR